MYCIKCGVELENGTKKCPLCGCDLAHPAFEKISPERTFPEPEYKRSDINRHGVMFVITFAFLIPALLTLVCDVSLNGAVVWSGYTAGSLVLIYVSACMPLWFKKPNPVIFLPIDFATALLFLWYINFATGENWFNTFALPVIIMQAVIFCAVVTLCKYLRRGHLYIFSGAFVAFGISLCATEYFMHYTFSLPDNRFWSIYPLTVFVLIGIMLLVIAICKPLKESLKHKFFL